MRKAWGPQQPVETVFKQIQDCADFLFLGGQRSTYWPSAANKCGICQDFCHMQLHEPSADGTRRTLRERHGQTSRYTSPQLIGSTSRCRGNHQPINDIMQQMQLLVKLKITCKKQPFAPWTIWTIWKLPQPLTAVWSQL
jgi:hypothetical protein